MIELSMEEVSTLLNLCDKAGNEALRDKLYDEYRYMEMSAYEAKIELERYNRYIAEMAGEA